VNTIAWFSDSISAAVRYNYVVIFLMQHYMIEQIKGTLELPLTGPSKDTR